MTQALNVGDSAQMSRTIEPGDIELFAQISGDRNPIHFDVAAAKRSKFGEIVVQGGLTTAILNAVVAEKLPGPGSVFIHVDWNFLAPARPGDIITGRVEVTDVREDKPIVSLATKVTRQDGTVLVVGKAVCYVVRI
jgi:acyl dehydratase